MGSSGGSKVHHRFPVSPLILATDERFPPETSRKQRRKKNMAICKQTTTCAVAIAVVFGAIATSSRASPVPLSATAGKEAAPIVMSHIRHYRGYRSRFYRNNDAGVGLDAWTVANTAAGAAALSL
jgi:hypothetical protein